MALHTGHVLLAHVSLDDDLAETGVMERPRFLGLVAGLFRGGARLDELLELATNAGGAVRPRRHRGKNQRKKHRRKYKPRAWRRARVAKLKARRRGRSGR